MLMINLRGQLSGQPVCVCVFLRLCLCISVSASTFAVTSNCCHKLKLIEHELLYSAQNEIKKRAVWLPMFNSRSETPYRAVHRIDSSY